VSRLGDLWTLGRHRVLCGDATCAADVEQVLGAVRPHLMVTDPPYGVEYDAEWRSDQSVAATLRHPKPGAVGPITNDQQVDWRLAWTLFPGDVAYVWHAGVKIPEAAASLVASGYDIRALIIWGKRHFAVGRGHYHHQHEPCFYAVRKGRTGHWNGDRSQTTLWDIDKPTRSETGHSAQKPVECMRRPIENNSSPGQAVYDPFLGSGTTIIAAEMTARSCLGLEIEPAYVDVIVRRWQDFTGDKAMLDGRSFEQIQEERRGQAQAQAQSGNQENRPAAVPAH
jgi:DNA modification methylase